MQCPDCHFHNPGPSKIFNACGGRLQYRFEADDGAAVFGNPPHQSSEKVDYDKFIEKFAGDAPMAILPSTSCKCEPKEP